MAPPKKGFLGLTLSDLPNAPLTVRVYGGQLRRASEQHAQHEGDGAQGEGQVDAHLPAKARETGSTWLISGSQP